MILKKNPTKPIKLLVNFFISDDHKFQLNYGFYRNYDIFMLAHIVSYLAIEE